MCDHLTDRVKKAGYDTYFLFDSDPTDLFKILILFTFDVYNCAITFDLFNKYNYAIFS